MSQIRRGVESLKEMVKEKVPERKVHFVERDIERPAHHFIDDDINISFWHRPSMGIVEFTFYNGCDGMNATIKKAYEITEKCLVDAGLSKDNKDHYKKLESHAEKIAVIIIKELFPERIDDIGFRPRG